MGAFAPILSSFARCKLLPATLRPEGLQAAAYPGGRNVARRPGGAPLISFSHGFLVPPAGMGSAPLLGDRRDPAPWEGCRTPGAKSGPGSNPGRGQKMFFVTRRFQKVHGLDRHAVCRAATRLRARR